MKHDNNNIPGPETVHTTDSVGFPSPEESLLYPSATNTIEKVVSFNCLQMR